MIYKRRIRSAFNPMGVIEITIEQSGRITVIEMAGELDSVSAPDVQEKIVPLVDEGCKILLDMSAVTYMSSAGLRILLMLYRQIREHVGDVVLAGLGDEVRDVMAITGFLDFFDVAEDRSDGIQLLDR